MQTGKWCPQSSNFRRLKLQLKLTWRPFAIGAIFKTLQSSQSKMCSGMPRAARRPAYLANSVNSVNLVLLDLLSLLAPLGSVNSHFFKRLFTKMAVSMVSDRESHLELEESHLMLKSTWLCFGMSSAFVGNNPSPSANRGPINLD